MLYNIFRTCSIKFDIHFDSVEHLISCRYEKPAVSWSMKDSLFYIYVYIQRYYIIPLNTPWYFEPSFI